MQQVRSATERQLVIKEFVFAGGSSSMIAARDTVMQFLSEHGVDGDEEIDIMIALQEALANAVLHGCGDDPAKQIHCIVTVDPAEISIVIRDPGPGFETASSSDSAEDGTNLTEHGRGILLMRSLMDEIHYSHRGAEVHMIKRRG